MNEEKEEKKEIKKEAKLSETLKKEVDNLNKKLEDLTSELTKAKSDIDQWKNSYYKAYADTENLRKSIERDHQEAMKYRAEGFITNLLPILDGFHLALNNEVKSEELKNYLIGFQYIYNNFVKVLEEEGVKEIAPKPNDKFDEKTMQAVDTFETEDTEPNKIVRVNAKGYFLKDRLVRPAMVVVSTPIKKEEEVKKESETPKENEDNQEKPLD